MTDERQVKSEKSFLNEATPGEKRRGEEVGREIERGDVEVKAWKSASTSAAALYGEASGLPEGGAA